MGPTMTDSLHVNDPRHAFFRMMKSTNSLGTIRPSLLRSTWSNMWRNVSIGTSKGQAAKKEVWSSSYEIEPARRRNEG